MVAELLRGRYDLLEVVGQGGEGRVVKAHDRQLDRVVALKIRTAVGGDRDQLLTEARTLLAVPPHPHLPLVREDFFDGDRYVIAMDWVEGTDLGRLLHAQGRPGLAPSLVVNWLADAAAALTHLHNQDSPVIHGDLKPANLILTRGGRVTIVDFGLSSTPGAPGRRSGSPGYVAPELARGDEAPTRATDVYALAATAFALLTGAPPEGFRPPWTGVEPEQAEGLERAIRAGLATDPARRPETPGQFVELLRAGWGESLPSGVLTFCFTDIEGSTGLWDEQPASMARALVVHDELIASAVERLGGRFLKSMGEGDATVSVFPLPPVAVVAAAEITRALAAQVWPGDLRLRARVALHTGEAEQRGGDYFGTTLNTAARIRGLADGGQVFLSSATAELVAGHLPAGASLVDLGPHQLRGVRAPETVYALAAPGVDAPPPADECPYPGLVALSVGDADRFFGREEVVAELRPRVAPGRLLAVLGGSGSGKSSLLQAGLLPAVGGGSVITPARHPLASLEADTGSGLLVVDQFEELFTLCDDHEERERFVARLLATERPVAIALRADFYGDCAAHPDLASAVAANQVLLGSMRDDELRRAIVEPARQAGLRVEPGLVDLLVAEVAGEPGALPLLAHVLRATWERRDGRTLTLAAYHETGGVHRAIADTADRVLDGFDASGRTLTRRLLLRMVQPGVDTPDTRRRAPLEELRSSGGDHPRVTAVLDAMAAARLVTLDGTTAEIAHEALIREWPTLRTWLDDDREGLRMHRQVTEAAAAWDELGRDPADLYRGPRLAAALDWLDGSPDLSDLEEDFLHAATAERDREARDQTRTNRRLRGLLVAAAIGLATAVVGASFAFVQGNRAGDERDNADIARLAALSRATVERQPDIGLLLAAEAFERDAGAESRSALLNAVTTHPLLVGLLYGVDSGLEGAAFSPDGHLLATPTSDGSGTLVWDTASRRQVAALEDAGAILLGAAFSPDGTRLVVPAIIETATGFDSGLQVWDLESETLERTVPSPAGALTSVWFSADGRQVVAQGGPTIDGPLRLEAVVWDTATWEPIGEPLLLADAYPDDRVIVVSADGQRIAFPSGDTEVIAWDVDTRQPLGPPIDAGFGPARAMAFSPDGLSLAVAYESGQVRVVDPSTGAPARELLLERTTPSAMEFSPDGGALAVATEEGETALFDLGTGHLLGPPLQAAASGVNDVSFSPDGRLLATVSVDRTGALWRLDGGRAIADVTDEHSAAVTEVQFTADGELVSAATDGTVVMQDTAGDEAPRRLQIGGEVLTVAIDPQSGLAAAAGTNGRVVVFDPRTGDRVASHQVPDGRVLQLVFHPHDGTIALAVQTEPLDELNGYVEVWDPSTDEVVGAPIGEVSRSHPLAVAWSPDGTQLAVSYDNTLVWVFGSDPDHEAVGDPIESPDSPVFSLAFSPDGNRLATGTTSGITRQWSTVSHEPVGAALEGQTGAIGGVAYSPDGSVLATTALGWSTTRIWDADSGALIGGDLVGGHTPETFRTFLIDHNQGSRPAFSPDGEVLAVPNYDGTVTLWSLRPERWLDAACGLVGRDLSAAEWRQFIGSGDPRPTCSG